MKNGRIDLFFEKIVKSKSKTFLAFCFCFIASSAVGSLLGKTNINVIFWGSLFLLFFIVIFSEYKTGKFLTICLCLILLGMWRASLVVPDCTKTWELCHYNGKKLTVEGLVSAEPALKNDSASYVVEVKQVVADKKSMSVEGKIMFSTRLYPVFRYGDRLRVTCPLVQPEKTDSFRFDKYAARLGVFSTCYFPMVEKISEKNGSQILFSLYEFKTRLNEKIALLWSEPEGSLMAGILYGSKSSIPKELAEDFSKTGISHIVAISGFNITIIVAVVMNVLLLAGFYRRQAFYAVVIFTILFVVFSGSSASAIRAAVLGIVALTGKQIGRPSSIGILLVFTAALMQLANPYYLLWDAGFGLSFLATLGLVYFSPILKRLWEPKIKIIVAIHEILVATVSAIILTLPLILFEFGTLSFIAPLVNILILPLVPFIMLLGAVSLGGSFLNFFAGKFLAVPAHAGMAYVIMVVQFFGKQSWTSSELSFPLWALILSYGIIFTIILKYKKI